MYACMCILLGQSSKWGEGGLWQPNWRHSDVISLRSAPVIQELRSRHIHEKETLVHFSIIHEFYSTFKVQRILWLYDDIIFDDHDQWAMLFFSALLSENLFRRRHKTHTMKMDQVKIYSLNFFFTIAETKYLSKTITEVAFQNRWANPFRWEVVYHPLDICQVWHQNDLAWHRNNGFYTLVWPG